jgi:general secretion pathway protein H
MGVLGRDSQVEDQSRRFWAVLRQAREESELQGLDAGVAVSANDYEFLRYSPRDSAWIPIVDDKLYATRKLPEGLRFRMWLDSREVILKPAQPKKKVEPKDEDDDGKPDIDRDQPPPQIVILSSGEIMPFELQIERDGAQSLWRVVAQADNDLRVERRADESRWQMIAQTMVRDDEPAAPKANARH